VSPMASGWSPLLEGILGLAGAAGVLAWQIQPARPAVLLLLAFVVLLLATPLWFFHYTGLTAPVLAIVCGAGLQQLLALSAVRSRPRLRQCLLAGELAGFALLAAFAAVNDEGQRFPSREFSAALEGADGCVTSDHPSALILTDSIGRNIDQGCALVIDLGGYSHDLGHADGSSRRGNEAFQQFALEYLRSGDRAILARFTDEDGWSKSTLRAIQSWRLLAESGRQSVRVPG
jgi:alpha-1,2-mannosyltransferase